MQIKLPTFYSVAKIMMSQLGVNINDIEFKRSDLIELDIEKNFDTSCLELEVPAKDKPFISLGKFYEGFFAKGSGNHRKTIGLRHVAFLLGPNQKQNVERFKHLFGEHSEILLPLHAFTENNHNIIPSIQIRSEYWGRKKTVVVEKKTGSQTVNSSVKVPLINS